MHQQKSSHSSARSGWTEMQDPHQKCWWPRHCQCQDLSFILAVFEDLHKLRTHWSRILDFGIISNHFHLFCFHDSYKPRYPAVLNNFTYFQFEKALFVRDRVLNTCDIQPWWDDQAGQLKSQFTNHFWKGKEDLAASTMLASGEGNFLRE